jgi:hypothetical protein
MWLNRFEKNSFNFSSCCPIIITWLMIIDVWLMLSLHFIKISRFILRTRTVCLFLADIDSMSVDGRAPWYLLSLYEWFLSHVLVLLESFLFKSLNVFTMIGFAYLPSNWCDFCVFVIGRMMNWWSRLLGRCIWIALCRFSVDESHDSAVLCVDRSWWCILWFESLINWFLRLRYLRVLLC